MIPKNLGNHLFKYAVFWPVVMARGERVFSHLAELDESQWQSPAALTALQKDKFERLIAEARRNVPHYRDSLNRSGINDTVRFEDLNRLPFVTKRDLIESNVGLRNEASTGPLTIKTTGGSTGQAVTVRKTRHATALETAANWRGFGWEGIDIGHRQARFWGVPSSRYGRFRAAAIDWVAHRRRYSAFQFSRDDMAGYLKRLARFRPQYLYGYVSMLRALAEYLVETNRQFPSDLGAVVTTAEPLTAPDRRLFERAFAAPVFNEYGCGELGTIAHECEKGTLHVHAENLLVEILPPSSVTEVDGAGEIVVTELNNVAMPLIRYRLGDFAQFTDTPCPCGRTLPGLKTVFGRSYDLVQNRAGQQLHGEFFMYIFEDARRQEMGILQFQVIQHDYENVTVKVVAGPGYSERGETFVRERIRTGLGPVDVAFEQVDEIARERSGKLRLVIGMTKTKT